MKAKTTKTATQAKKSNAKTMKTATLATKSNAKTMKTQATKSPAKTMKTLATKSNAKTMKTLATKSSAKLLPPTPSPIAAVLSQLSPKQFNEFMGGDYVTMAIQEYKDTEQTARDELDEKIKAASAKLLSSTKS